MPVPAGQWPCGAAASMSAALAAASPPRQARPGWSAASAALCSRPAAASSSVRMRRLWAPIRQAGPPLQSIICHMGCIRQLSQLPQCCLHHSSCRRTSCHALPRPPAISTCRCAGGGCGHVSQQRRYHSTCMPSAPDPLPQPPATSATCHQRHLPAPPVTAGHLLPSTPPVSTTAMDNCHQHHLPHTLQ